MMKKLLSIFTVLLLASVLAVGAFAASAQLVLDGTETVDTDALVNQEQFTVYVVLSPMTVNSSNMYYRPAGSTHGGKGFTSADIASQTFTIDWSAYADYLTLVGYEVSQDRDSTADFTSKGSSDADLYWAKAIYPTGTGSRAKVNDLEPTVNDTTVANGVLSVSFARESGLFTGYRVDGSVANNAVVAKFTFKVIKEDRTDKEINLTLKDNYVINNAAASEEQFNLSVTVAAATGCFHTVESDRVNNKISEVVASCTVPGSVTFTCSECSEVVTENTGYAPHNYTNADGSDNVYVYPAPTCTTEGASVVKCTACGFKNEETKTTLPANGHAFANGDAAWATIEISKKSCTVDGKVAYYCQVCHALLKNAPVDGDPLKDAEVYTDWYYNDGHYYRDAALSNERFGVSAPANSVKVDLSSGHNIVKVNGKYRCTNEGCEGDILVRYVGATNKNGASSIGATKDDYISYQDAIDYFASLNLPEGDSLDEVNCKIVILKGVKAPINARAVSLQNEVTTSFEEKAHKLHITVTSEDKNNKSGIHFAEGCNSYFLYGNTTFENITISADTTDGTFIAARGFKLVMGKGIECLGFDGGVIEKTNSETAVSSALDLTLEIPDVKLYLIGGLLATGGKLGGLPGVDKNNNLSTYMEVHSGQYWAIYHYNRSVTTGLNNCKGIVYLAGDTETAVLNVNTESGAINNCYALTLYDGPVKIGNDFRYKQTDVEGSGNVYDRVFLDGAADMKVGRNDFGNIKTVQVAMNIYYSTAMANNAYVTAYIKKYTSGTNAGFYNFDGVTGSASKWCSFNSADAFGTTKHVAAANGKCAFCKTYFCKYDSSHTLVTEVELEPTCSTTGSSFTYCSKCYTLVSANEMPVDENAHNVVWDYSGDIPCAECSLCHKEYDNVTLPAGGYSNVDAVYVSVNGYTDGGFSPAKPISDFGAAMTLAAKANKPITVYVIGKAIVPGVDYTEPAHSEIITIKGYSENGANNRATLEIGGATGTAAKIFYRMSGPTTFENVKFSTGLSYASKAYIVAGHHPLVLGKNLSADIKNTSSALTSRIDIIGGCYSGSSCSKSGTDVTIYSGEYNGIIAGSTSGSNCGTSNALSLKLLGDISAIEYIVFGNHSIDADTVNVVINGNVMCNAYIAFGSYKSTAKTTNNVNIEILGGGLRSDAASATARNLGAYRSVTATETPLSTDFIKDPADGGGKLTIKYDNTNSSVAALVKRIESTSDSAKFAKEIIVSAPSCTEHNCEHSTVGIGTVVAPTCNSEGYTEYTCDNCGCVYTADKTEMTAHEFLAENEVKLDATCVSAGLIRKICSYCNLTVYEIDPAGSAPKDPGLLESHNFGDDGICKDCNKSRVVVCGDIGHNEVATTVTKTCGVGNAYQCTVCGNVRVDIQSESHNYGAFSVTVEPTASAPGVKTRTCKGCGKVDTALLYATDALATTAVATTANGGVADLEIATSKLSKTEKAALNALLQDTAYGSEIKVSYDVEGNTVSNITYSIPVPEEYAKLAGVKIVVKDDEGKLHVVDFKIDKGYFVFTF